MADLEEHPIVGGAGPLAVLGHTSFPPTPKARSCGLSTSTGPSSGIDHRGPAFRNDSISSTPRTCLCPGTSLDPPRRVSGGLPGCGWEVVFPVPIAHNGGSRSVLSTAGQDRPRTLCSTTDVLSPSEDIRSVGRDLPEPPHRVDQPSRCRTGAAGVTLEALAAVWSCSAFSRSASGSKAWRRRRPINGTSISVIAMGWQLDCILCDRRCRMRTISGPLVLLLLGSGFGLVAAENDPRGRGERRSGPTATTRRHGGPEDRDR